MARIFITGSTDGLGKLAGQSLLKMGHEVTWHARNRERANDLRASIPNLGDILVGDLSDQDETILLAEKVNSSGPFDAIIHNAGVYRASEAQIFRINTLAPYMLTCLIDKPKRLVYMSSGDHFGGRNSNLDEIFQFGRARYSDSKLHDLMLAKAVARKWPDVYSNAVDPGWVPTKMGGPGAPDDLQKGYETQVWLSVSDDNDAKVSGKYFHHQRQESPNPSGDNIDEQDRMMSLCEEYTGIPFPYR